MKRYFKSICLKSFQSIRIIIYRFLSDNSNIIGNCIINQPVLINGKGKVTFNSNVQLGFNPSPYFLSGYIYLEARNVDSEICIGNNSIANNNLVVVAESGKILIGDNVLIGTNVEIINSDFHHVDPNKRESGKHKSKDVIIENNVFIGSNVKINKGVRIGENSVISNGTVVFDDVPSNCIFQGNPGKLYKNILQ